MERIKELFVVVENRPGALGELLGVLSKEKINVEALGLFGDIAKLSLNDIDRAKKSLTKAGYSTEEREVIRLDLDNRPGTFAVMASRLGSAGLNIDYCYATVTKGERGASVILDVGDIDRAMGVLEGVKA